MANRTSAAIACCNFVEASVSPVTITCSSTSPAERIAELERERKRLEQELSRGQALLRALLQAFYSIRSERAFCERLNYDLLFKWFLDMRIDQPAFDEAFAAGARIEAEAFESGEPQQSMDEFFARRRSK